MRISLLKEREPFAETLASTLERFLRSCGDAATQVNWLDRKRNSPANIWLCNEFLNCIFRPSAPPEVFGPIQSEYGTSTRRWRTPAQRLYVFLATRSALQWSLSQGRLAIDPVPDDSRSMLVIPGNTRIRIANHQKKTAWVVLKEGFDRDRFLEESRRRQHLLDLQLPVPRILERNDEQAYYCEDYLVGVPVNRLRDRQRANRLTQDAYLHLAKLVKPSLHDSTVEAYCERCQKDFDGISRRLNCLDADQSEALRQVFEPLLVEAIRGPNRTSCAETHGDFQPGNVLWGKDQLWLIDWEYSAVRIATYDPMVMSLASRFPMGLAGRLAEFIRTGEMGVQWPAQWPVVQEDSLLARRQQAHLFLAEELLLHMRENAPSLIQRPGDGLISIMREARAFRQLMKTSVFRI